MQKLKQLWRPSSGRATGERWYGEELARHWEGLDMWQRANELVKLIQWRNLLDEAEHDGSDARVVGMTAAIAEKVQLLSFAIDVTYGTNYSERLYLDPLQFGVHEMRG